METENKIRGFFPLPYTRWKRKRKKENNKAIFPSFSHVFLFDFCFSHGLSSVRSRAGVKQEPGAPRGWRGKGRWEKGTGHKSSDACFLVSSLPAFLLCTTLVLQQEKSTQVARIHVLWMFSGVIHLQNTDNIFNSCCTNKRCVLKEMILKIYSKRSNDFFFFTKVFSGINGEVKKEKKKE